MRSPVDAVKGHIVGYDEKRQELLIRAPYDDYVTMTKRGYKNCLVQLVDSRPLSDRQRRMCYALLREIGEYTGHGTDTTKEYMKLKFMVEDMEQTADKIFSLVQRTDVACLRVPAVSDPLHFGLGHPLPVPAAGLCGRCAGLHLRLSH